LSDLRSPLINDAIAAIRPPDEAARAEARALQQRLTKPSGALGRLEDLHVWAAGLLREPAPDTPRKMIVVAAGDHGVVAQGVSAYPREVTWQMVGNLLGGGAAVNVLAAHAGAEVRVVDAGVLRDTHHPNLHVAKVRAGTGDVSRGPAMTRDEAAVLVERGIAFARREVGGKPAVIGLGDMGIGNTTAAAAITSVMTFAPPGLTAGRGTGIDDATLARKIDTIERALAVNGAHAGDPLDVLAKVGGCEIAFLVGVTIGAAAGGSPVVLDGYPTSAAALLAAAMAPTAIAYMLASHVSAEHGHRIALDHLGLTPLLDLRMRLGEGTGAVLAMTLVDAALRIPREMATFDSAGVSQSEREAQPEA
jgi:nicotinate-nucleotide--dimethylbenzimidazole phosphoribosyltransferase